MPRRAFIYCIMGGRAQAAFVFAAVLLLSLAAGGCSKTVAEFYSDFLLNEDVQGRFEICYADIGKGHETAYTEGELETLIEDLEYGYAVEDEDAELATSLFQDAAKALIEAMHEEKPAQSVKYENARELFDMGWQVSLSVREGAYDE